MAKTQDSLVLILHDEKKGIEKALAALYAKNLAAKSGSTRPVKGILVAFRNLSGAIYHPRTVSADYWDGEIISEGPGRTSVIFHPMYMEEKAIYHYLEECEADGSLPVILADHSIADRRGIKSDSSIVAREFYSIRAIAELTAKKHGLAFTEFMLEEV